MSKREDWNENELVLVPILSEWSKNAADKYWDQGCLNSASFSTYFALFDVNAPIVGMIYTSLIIVNFLWWNQTPVSLHRPTSVNASLLRDYPRCVNKYSQRTKVVVIVED